MTKQPTLFKSIDDAIGAMESALNHLQKQDREMEILRLQIKEYEKALEDLSYRAQEALKRAKEIAGVSGDTLPPAA